MAAGVAAVLLAVFLSATVGAAEPAAAATSVQCNSVDNTPGLGMECDVTIVNNLDLATGVAELHDDDPRMPWSRQHRAGELHRADDHLVE